MIPDDWEEVTQEVGMSNPPVLMNVTFRTVSGPLVTVSAKHYQRSCQLKAEDRRRKALFYTAV